MDITTIRATIASEKIYADISDRIGISESWNKIQDHVKYDIIGEWVCIIDNLFREKK